MSEYDLIVKRGTLVRADGVGTRDIAVADGEIVEVAEEIAGGAREEIDADGLHVFPGGVDIRDLHPLPGLLRRRSLGPGVCGEVRAADPHAG
jgi:allantoinase